jgi:hypothetical protein
VSRDAAEPDPAPPAALGRESPRPFRGGAAAVRLVAVPEDLGPALELGEDAGVEVEEQ